MAAIERAPEGSTTRRLSSAARRTDATISASETVTIRSSSVERCANVRTPSDCVRVPSASVRLTSSAGQLTILPRSSDSRASAASSGSTPITFAERRMARMATATPLARPPPPTGTSTAARSGRSCAISSPTVPWPAMIRSSSNGGMITRPRSWASCSARACRSSLAGPTQTISAPSAATRRA